MPPAHFLRTFHHDVDAMRAYESNEKGAHEAHRQTSVAEGERHRQNARAETAFCQMDQSVQIPKKQQIQFFAAPCYYFLDLRGRMLQLPLQKWIFFLVSEGLRFCPFNPHLHI
jgi:hypothetical protein